MNLRGIGLLFFSFFALGSLWADDYVVAKGDTGSSIAVQKKLPLEVLQRANPDLDWKRIKVGDKVFVPDRYTVKTGDTLYSLTRSWGVDQAAVLALNNLSGPSSLKVGQVLFLPPRAKAAAAVSVLSDAPFWPVERTPRPENDKIKSVTFATSGEPFRSVTQGTVVYVGEFRGVGRVLFVQSADKAVYAYGNFESATVQYGQNVARGQTLGVTSSRAQQKLSFFAFRQSDSLDVFTAKR